LRSHPVIIAFRKVDLPEHGIGHRLQTIPAVGSLANFSNPSMGSF